MNQWSAHSRRGGPEPGRIGNPCEIAWNDSSHSILNEFMHAEYGIFVYTIWPLFSAAPHQLWSESPPGTRRHTPPTRAVPDLFGRRGGPEPGRIGNSCEIAWNESSR